MGKIFIKFSGKGYRYLKALFGFMFDMNVQLGKLEKHVQHICEPTHATVLELVWKVEGGDPKFMASCNCP